MKVIDMEVSFDKRGYSCIGLDNPKSSKNVGIALRAGAAYGVSFIAITGKRFGKFRTDPNKQWRHRPFLEVQDLKDVIPYSCVPIAVELIEGAVPLPEYKHPERAFYIFGAEDGTLCEEIISWCQDIVYIPTDRCINLAATVNVVLYDRMVKRVWNKQCPNLQ